jgi:hypothetical protein
MNTYRLQLQPLNYGVAASGVARAIENAIVQTLDGAAIRELSHAHRSWTLDVQVERPSHQVALNEIFIAVQRLGFSVLNTTVTEWTDRAVETAVAGAFGGGGIGSLTRNPDVAGVAALAGLAIGALVGSQLHKVERVYELRTTTSGWVLVPVPKPASAGLDPTPSTV